MKVLHVVPSLNPALGGPTRVVLDLVNALRQQGVDAEIATTNDCGQTTFDVPLGCLTTHQGAPVRFFARSALRRKEFIASFPLAAWLAEQARSYDVVDIHYLFTFSGTAAAWAARRADVPYVLRTMGQLAPWSLRQSYGRKLLYGMAFERRNLSDAALVHCTSDGEAKDVLKYSPHANICTLPLGVLPHRPVAGSRDEVRSRYQIPPDGKIVLFLSRLHPKKQPDVLIDAVVRLSAKMTGVHLILAGTGDPSYERLLRERIGREDRNIIFAGFVEGRRKDELLSAADCFVLPSLSENFGMAVAEALAAELPVIVSPAVDIASLIEAHDGGMVVAPDAAAVAAALESVLSTPERAARLGRNGKRLAEDVFCWNQIAGRWKQLYQQISARSPMCGAENECSI